MLALTVNMLGVVAATVVGLIFGFIWYSPALFGKAWMDSVKGKGKMPKMNAFGFFMIVVSSFVTALVLGALIGLAGANSLGGGFLVALILWMGFFFSKEIVAAAMMHNGRMLAINGFHDLIALFLMAAVIILI